MDARLLLIAICCTLPAAQARPAGPDASSCSQACKGSNFWSGYSVGSTYKYEFEQEVEIASGQSEQKSSIVKAIGTASVEVHSACERVLTVQLTGSKVSKSADEPDTMQDKDLPDSLREALAKPLRFSYEDGRIRQVCPDADETRVSLNLKRAILSQMQISVENSKQQGVAMETDILGVCQTKFSFSGENKIKKSKDLSTCSGGHEVFPRRGVKVQKGNEQVAGMKGEVTCDLAVEGDRLQSSVCVEERVLGPGGPGLAEKVTSRTRLELKETTAGLASSLSAVGMRSDLRHAHKDGAECADSQDDEEAFQFGSECSERKQLPTADANQAKYKQLAQAAVTGLCTMSQEGLVRDTIALKIAEVIKTFRAITAAEDLKAIVSGVATGPCGNNDLFKKVFFSSFPAVGTKQSAKVILQLSQEADFEDYKKKWMLDGIAMVPNPSPEILRVVLDNVKANFDSSFDELEGTFDNTQILSLSVLVGRYCKADPDCDAEEVVNEAVSFISAKAGTGCSADNQVVVPVLIAIGNIGRVGGGASTLMACARNSSLPAVTRVFAVRALDKFPSLTLEEKNQLASIVLSNSYDSELRIVAYQMLAKHADMSYRNSPNVANQLSRLLFDREQDLQVQLFVYSHLRSLIQIRGRRPFRGAIENIVKRFDRQARRQRFFGLGYSKYMRMVYRLPAVLSQLDVESTVIYSKSSPIPRHVSLNLTVDTPLTGEALNIFQLGVRAQDLEALAKTIYNLVARPSSLQRKRRQATMTESQKNFEVPKASAGKPRLDIVMSKFGMQYSHKALQDDFFNLISAVTGAIPAGSSAADIAETLQTLGSSSAPTSVRFGGVGLDVSVSVPSISGFPVVLKKELYYVVDLGFETSSSPKVELKLKPFASAHLIRTFSIDAGFEKIGFRTTSDMLSSTGLKLTADIQSRSKSDFKYSFKVESLQDKQRIFNLQTKAFFYGHGADKKVTTTPLVSEGDAKRVTRKCSDPFLKQKFGREFCIATSYAKTVKQRLNMYRTPGSYEIYVNKTDGGALEATVSFKRDDDENADTRIELLIGDRSSGTRHWRLFYERDSEPDSRTINFELRSPLLRPVTFNSVARMSGDSSVNANLTIGLFRYSFKGNRRRISNQEAGVSGSVKAERLAASGAVESSFDVQLAVEYGFYGFLADFLPMTMFKTKLEASDSRKYTFFHSFNVNSSRAAWQFESTNQAPGSEPFGVKSRIEWQTQMIQSKKRRSSFLYDLELTRQTGAKVSHNFQATMERTKRGNRRRSVLQMQHTYTDSRSSEPSKLNFDANVQLDETREADGMQATGSGEIKRKSGDGSVAKLSNLNLFIGNGPDEIDSNPRVEKMSLKYDLEVAGKKSKFDLVAQALPNVDAVYKGFSARLELTDMRAASPKKYSFTVKNFVNSAAIVPEIDQAVIVSLPWRTRTLKHSLKPVVGSANAYRHFIQIDSAKVANTFKAEGFRRELTTAAVFGTATFNMTQSVVFQPAANSLPLQLEYKMNIKCSHMRNAFALRIARTLSEQTGRNAYNLMRSSSSRVFLNRLAILIAQLKVTRTIEVSSASSYKVQSTFDFAQGTGDVIDVTVTRDGSPVRRMTLNRQARGFDMNNLMRAYKLTVVKRGRKKEIEVSVETKREGGKKTCKKVLKYSKDDSLKYHLEVNNEFESSQSKFSAKSVLSAKKGSKVFSEPYTATTAFSFDRTDRLQPTATMDLVVKTKSGSEASVKYTLDCTRIQWGLFYLPTKIDSLVEISSDIAKIAIPSISSRLIMQTDDDVFFKYSFVNEVEGVKILSQQMEITESGISVGVSSENLGAIFFQYNYESTSPGVYNMKSNFTVQDSAGNRVSMIDVGRMWFRAGDGFIIDSGYNGSTSISGSDNAIGRRIGLDLLARMKFKKVFSDMYFKVKRSGDFDTRMIFNVSSLQEEMSFAIGVAATYKDWPVKLTGLLYFPFKFAVPYSQSQRIGFDVNVDVNGASSGHTLNGSIVVFDPFTVGSEFNYGHVASSGSLVANANLMSRLFLGNNKKVLSDMKVTTNGPLKVDLKLKQQKVDGSCPSYICRQVNVSLQATSEQQSLVISTKPNKFSLQVKNTAGSGQSTISLSTQVSNMNISGVSSLAYNIENYRESAFLNYSLNANGANLFNFSIGYNVRQSKFAVSSGCKELYNGRLAVINDQDFGEVTNANGIEFKLNYKLQRNIYRLPILPITVRVWSGTITRGQRMAVEVNGGSSRTAIILGDITEFTKTGNLIKFKFRGLIRNHFFKDFLRFSAESATFCSFLRGAGNDYRLVYNEVVKFNSNAIYEMKSNFTGQGDDYPSAMAIAFVDGPYVAGLSYNFESPETDAAFIRYSQSRLGNIRGRYLVEFKLNAPTDIAAKTGRDFSLEMSCPINQAFISRRCQQVSSSQVKTVVEIFYDKRQNEGVNITVIRGRNAAGYLLRSVEIGLPSRAVGFDRSMKIGSGSVAYNLTIYWDKKRNVNQKFVVNSLFNSASELSGNQFNASVKLSSSLLASDIRKKLAFKSDAEGFSIVASSDCVADVTNAVLKYRKFWAEERRAYQKEFSFTLRNNRGSMADFNVSVESMHLGQSRLFSPWKYLTVYNLYSKMNIPETDIPVQIDRHYRLRSVPFEELTLGSKDGTSFSFRLFRGSRSTFFRAFVANRDRQAAQLKVQVNRQRPWTTMKLCRGAGFVNPKTQIGMPTFTPETVLVKAAGGLSKCGTREQFSMFFGEMPAATQSIIWKPSQVPAGVNFWTVKLRIVKPNSVNYQLSWRASSSAKRPLTYIREELVDRWRMSSRIPFSPAAVGTLIATTAGNQMSCMNLIKVLGTAQSFSTDYDRFVSFASKVARKRPGLQRAWRNVYNQVKLWAKDIKSRSSSPVRTPEMPDIRPTTAISYAMRGMEAVIQNVVGAAGSAMRKIRRNLDRMTAGQDSPPVSVSEPESSRRTILQFRRLQTLMYEMARIINGIINVFGDVSGEQFMEMMQFGNGNLGQLGMDTFARLQETAVLFEKLGKLAQLMTLPQSNGASRQYSRSSSKYSEPLRRAVRLFVSGNVRQAVRVLRTEVHKLNELRYCGSACISSGSFGVMNGTVNLPYYIEAFRRPRQRKFGSIVQNYISKSSMTGSQKSQFPEAQVTDDSIKTFGGYELTQLRPCKYLLAHDYRKKSLTVYQSFTMTDGSLQRSTLLIQFGAITASVEADNSVTVDGESVVTTNKQVGDTAVRVDRKGTVVSLEFDGDLKNALRVRCNYRTSKCRVNVHPMYFNKINGAFGSSDRNPRNDLAGGSEEEHLRLWNSGVCAE